MNADLRGQVNQIARRARRLVYAYGLAWFVAMICLAALVVGALDYFLRFQDVGVRLICFCMLCAFVTWGFFRFVYAAFRYRCSDLQAARRIERRFPFLRDRLSSAVEFASHANEDPLAGSLELRRVVITETEGAVADLDFSGCLDRRPSLRAMLVAALAVGAIVVLGILDGGSVSLAAKRLLVPWGADQWPRRHVLRFVHAPTRLAAGEDFDIEVIDAGGHLPDRVEIHFWFDGVDASKVQTQEMRRFGSKMKYAQADVTRGFRYRVTGGDDQEMRWIRLEIVEPPRLVKHEVMLHPPDYSGLEPRLADGNFRTLEGTRITLSARVDKPLSAAWLKTDTVPEKTDRADAETDAKNGAADGYLYIPLALDADRRGFALKNDSRRSWTIAMSGTYSYRLINHDGLEIDALAQWEVESISDSPPTVSLKRPAANLHITSRAVVAVESIVKDDVALRSVELHFTRSNQVDRGDRSFSLWRGPAQATRETDASGRGDDEGVQRTVLGDWDLTELALLTPGEWIDFHVVASDYKLQAGRSATRRITVISPEDLEDRIAQRQAEILTQIAEVARLETQTRLQITELEIQLNDVGLLEREDIDQLQSAELNQRQVHQRLGHPSDGMASQINSLLEELASNRVDSPDMVRRLLQLSDEIRSLNETMLPSIEHQLVDALKLARDVYEQRRRAPQSVPDPDATGQLLSMTRRASQGQEQVIRALEQMLERLSQWDSYRKLASEVGRLRRDQEETRQRTERLRLDTLTRDLNDLTSQERAAVRRLAERQKGIARQFESLRNRMHSTRQQLMEEDPMASATLSDALDMIQRHGIGSTMRDVGREMGRNRLGRATEQQDVVVQQLRELQDVLANRREQQLDKRNDQLRAAAAELSRLQDRQRAAKAAARQGEEKTPAELKRIGDDEARLAQDVRGLSRRVKRLQAELAETALDQADKQLEMASQAAAQGDRDSLLQHAEKAERNMTDAQRQLQRALADTMQRLHDERLKHLRQSLVELHARQAGILDETRQVEASRDPRGDVLSAELSDVVHSLVAEQLQLGQEVAELAQSVADIEAFAIALGDVAAEMNDVRQRLEQLDTSAATTQLQQRVIDHLGQILKSLDQDVPPAAHGEQPRQPPGAKEGNDQAKARYLLQQLKMIRVMQDDVNRKTAALHAKATASKTWSDDQIEEQNELIARQGRLAELVTRLVETRSGDDAETKSAPNVEENDGLDGGGEEGEH